MTSQSLWCDEPMSSAWSIVELIDDGLELGSFPAAVDMLVWPACKEPSNLASPQPDGSD